MNKEKKNKLIIVMIILFLLGVIFGAGVSYEFAKTQLEDFNNVTKCIEECNTKLLRCNTYSFSNNIYSVAGEIIQ